MRGRKRYDRKRGKGTFVANQLNKLTRHFEGDAQIGGGNETLLSIGQMARLNAVSEKALRLYQAKGILEPAYTDEASGYRYYTLGQCATLDMICQLRCVGFSLEEIAETLKDSDVTTLRDRVRDHVQQIETQMHELAQAHQVGGDLLRSCEVYLDKPPCNQLMLESMPERRVLEFPLSRVETSEPEGDGAHAMGAWELNLRFVKREIVERELPLSLFRNVGCIIARDDLLAGCIRYDRAFVFVTPAFGEDVFREAKRIPAQTCLCEYIDGVFTNDGRERETVELAHMLEECEKRGMEPAGDYRGEIIADSPAFLYEGREMLFKMCLPVRLKDQPTWQMPVQRDVMGSWRGLRDTAADQASLFHEGNAKGR